MLQMLLPDSKEKGALGSFFKNKQGISALMRWVREMLGTVDDTDLANYALIARQHLNTTYLTQQIEKLPDEHFIRKMGLTFTPGVDAYLVIMIHSGIGKFLVYESCNMQKPKLAVSLPELKLIMTVLLKDY